MSKKFINNGNSTIAFETELRVKPGDTIELSDEVLTEKKEAMEIMIEAGQLKEVSKSKPIVEKPKETKYSKEAPVNRAK